MNPRVLAWFRSLHAKLFLLTAAVTSFLTVAVAFSITKNSRKELEDYSRRLLVEASETVQTEVVERDPHFDNPRKLEEMLESIAGKGRSIFQIDVFKRVEGKQVELVKSSGEEANIGTGKDLASYLDIKEAQTELVELVEEDGKPAGRGWKVYLAIPNPKQGRPSIGLIRAYIDLERWDAVWTANRNRTLNMLPGVLVGEFILLWLILRWLISDPLDALVEAMVRLERGEEGARAEVQRRDELGVIATRFNAMAQRLQRASKEREQLIQEIQSLNTGLQDRVDQALQELQDKNEELAQQERLAIAGQLTAAFAHEVGTPLNLVTGHLQLLQGQEDLPEKAQERIGIIQAQIQRVGDIVRRLLDMTRRPQIAEVELSIPAFIQELQQLWNPTLAKHHAHLEVDVPPECVIRADRKQMEQLFLNLMNNALDAMPEGGVVRIRAEREEPARWRFRFEDTGTGIPAEVLPHIFRPMLTTKPEGKGTGLGLPICRDVVRGHGGEIRAESQVGVGTTMMFTLPAA
ncbi:MAG TPA: ATP-binding protein [Holophagaceae bacterium]|nr:ATP-binding protein [Holophagaceae bacterium]